MTNKLCQSLSPYISYGYINEHDEIKTHVLFHYLLKPVSIAHANLYSYLNLVCLKDQCPYVG